MAVQTSNKPLLEFQVYRLLVWFCWRLHGDSNDYLPVLFSHMI